MLRRTRMFGPRRRRITLLVAGAVAAAGLALAAYLVVRSRTDDVKHGLEVPFQAPSRSHRIAPADTFQWPFYGYTKARTRYLAAPLRPPFKPIWSISGRVLLEFSPVLANGVLYLAKNNGAVWAIRAGDGKVLWKRRLADLNASSPAYAGGRVFVATLSRKVAALDARNGRVRWSWTAASRVESSPVVDRGTAYFGSENGTLYAISARSGHVKWTFRAGGALKAAPALANGILYIGDYGGRMYAIRARDGSVAWSTGTRGAHFGFAGGYFYATPAVAFGRVYAGNTDGKVYSFSARTGELAWSHSTGSYVYASPAVADVPGTRPSVYVGSYDGSFYALDARTGDVRWVHDAGGRISGAATVVGDVVYYANLGTHRTVGLSVRTGKRVFRFKTGAFNPVISDGRRIYLTGYSSLWALVPKGQGRVSS